MRKVPRDLLALLESFAGAGQEFRGEGYRTRYPAARRRCRASPHVRFGGVARRSAVVLSTRERLRVRKRGGRRADSDLDVLAASTAAEKGAEFPPRRL